GAAPVAVISFAAWRGVFGEDSRVVGKHLTFEEDGVAYTIVGVMPGGLAYPNGTEIWLPITPLTTVNDSTAALVDVVGRLTRGANRAGAESELGAFLSRANVSTAPATVRAVVRPLPEVVLRDARPAVVTFAAAAALLLLITCMNVANLLLVRGLARAREIAVRIAIGATRSQLVAYVAAEHVVLAAAGGAIGLALAALAVKGLIMLAPADIPLLDTVRFEPRVVIAAVVLSAGSMIVFGVIPAILAMQMQGYEVLRAGTHRSASRRSRIAREVLVGAQV